MKLRLLYPCLLLFLNLAQGAVVSDNFESRESFKGQWATWGEGRVSLDRSVRYSGKHSVSLVSESGEEVTLYRKFQGLKKPFVEVSFWLKVNRLSKGLEIFYLNPKGEHHFLSHSISGSLNWSQLSFRAPVTQGKFELWVRLKSPGRLWIDDFSLSETLKSATELSYTAKSANVLDPFQLTPLEGCGAHATEARRTLLRPTEGGLPSKISSQKYYHLDVDRISREKITHRDVLELEVFFESREALPFYFILSDQESNNYWQQLNHTVNLHPGLNRIRVPLGAFVGERGSHGERRKINLKRLSKVYFIVDPDKKAEQISGIKIGPLSLYSTPRVKSFEGLYAFDFTTKVEEAMPCFIPITAYHQMTKEDEFGFRSLMNFRPADSVFTDTLNRYSLDLEKASFEVKLPNGKYRLSLIASKLGYWDTPFWKRRLIEIQGKPVLLELRQTTDDYLKDYLRFETTWPTPKDHPWDLYLAKIFRPLVYDFEVTNGRVTLDFEGDPSAFSLNSLIIWKREDDKRAQRYLAELEEVQRAQFDLIAVAKHEQRRSAPLGKAQFHVFKEIERLHPETDFHHFPGLNKFSDTLFKEDQSLINFALALPKETQVKVTLEGADSLQVKLYQGRYRYMSLDRNHQSYSLATRQLETSTLEAPLKLEGGVNHHFFLRLSSSQAQKAGTLRAKLKVELNGVETFEFPIELKLMGSSLPRVDFPVGFLGLQSLHFNYFKAPIDQVRALRLKMAEKAFEELKERGFTTFSGLPSILDEEGKVDTKELDQFLELATKHGFVNKIFTYSGATPSEVLERWGSVNQSELIPILNKYFDPPKRAQAQLIFTYSDEALGYAGTVERDIKRGEFLRKTFPSWKLGGFSQVDKSAKAFMLNHLFDEGSYSHYEPKEMERLESAGLHWGLYNQAAGVTQNPRFSMGIGLYVGRSLGLSHLLGWHLSAFHNYPYYDLDGRENDAVMLYPSSNGELLSTVKFEQATQGIRDYRKLKWLESKGQIALVNKKRLGKLKEQLPSDFLSRDQSVHPIFDELALALLKL